MSKPDVPTLSNSLPGVLECPGLKRPLNAPVSWEDSTSRVQDLADARLLTFDEVAADPLVADLGFATAFAVGELVRAGRLYPVFRKNSRVIRVFACGVADFRRRQITTPPQRHLMQTRAQRVA